MEGFLLQKKRKLDASQTHAAVAASVADDDTDLKLAILASLNPDAGPDLLLEALISSDGSVETATAWLSNSNSNSNSSSGSGSNSSAVHDPEPEPKRRLLAPSRGIGYQSSLQLFRSSSRPESSKPVGRLTRKGQTLHLYSPEDIAAHTPCSIVHNFLPADEADGLLRELLDEAKTFNSAVFKLFDNVVKSPHSACFYVNSAEEQQRQRTEYMYNGSYLTVRTSSYITKYVESIA